MGSRRRRFLLRAKPRTGQPDSAYGFHAQDDPPRTLEAWQTAHAVVLIGFGFGSGQDAISFEDFGRLVPATAPVHVLGPPGDNADLTRQVGHALRGRLRPGLYAQPFRWRQLAEA